ncbi:hypothetical protein UFOVP406_31 [uncultured Caudovirales phage]|uniref:Uncharacterized protein n=1 Tax=uncultured Caudovirales phage TaxID=2100421 RepID=A0A6J5M142_9CAUD|nr:hypothetical protein UFOVP406_31 [uncultured Caudovirales phage]
MTNPPSCFGSRRMPHHRAENSCHDCPFEQPCDRIEALTAENERLREALKEAHWFYLGDDCSSDQCRFGIDECISEDFEWGNPARGDHVLQISGARPVPDMWVALHYFTDAEKDERDDDDPYAYTVHATEEEARAALGEPTDE